MADTDRIKRNLGKMIDQGAPESDINAYLSTEGYSSPEAWRSALASPAAKPKAVGAAMVGPSPRIEDAPSLEPGPRTSTMPDVQSSWGQVAGNALKNLPRSLWNDVAVPTYKAVTERPVETLSAIPKVIVGALESLPQPQGTEKRREELSATRPEFVNALRDSKAMAGAVGQDFVDAYGSENALKHTLSEHPGRVLMDVASVGTAGAALPGRVGQTASVLSKLDPLTMGGNALKYGVAKPAEYVGSNVLGMTTGAGTESIRAAGRAGREGGEAAATFTENMRGAPVSDVVDRARTALDQIRQERSAAYKGDMAKLGQDDTVLNFDAIDGAVGKASQVGSFKGVSIEPAAQEVVARMAQQIEDWKALDPSEYHTAVGIDALKRSLGNLRDSAGPNTPERVAADRIYNAVRAEITSQAPEYAKTMEAYSRASDTINETSKTFSLSRASGDDTPARKLLSATRNNVQTNYGERNRLLNVLAEKDPTLPDAIAGQSLNALTPRGLPGRGGAVLALGGLAVDPISSLAYLAASSPRIVGEAVYAGGKLVGAVDDLAAALGVTPARIRALGQGGYQAGRPEDIRQRAMDLRTSNALAAP